MNTRKQVLVMTGLLMMMLVITGVYAAWYPSRAEDSAEHFEEARVERAALIFARNCRACHGDVAEGGAAGGRLPAAPALHRPDLQGFKDSTVTVGTTPISATADTITLSAAPALPFKGGDTILIDEERMVIDAANGTSLTVERGTGHTEAAPHAAAAPVYLFDKAAFNDTSATGLKAMIRNTISCGRVGTPMQAWSQTYGGNLSDEQITQLITLITTGQWEVVKEEVDHEDLTPAKLLTPVDPETINIQISDVSLFSENEYLRLAEERVKIVGVTKLPKDAAGNLPKDRSGIIEIQRGVLGTTPLDHSLETIIYRFPVAPTPSINQVSCGQTFRPPAVAGPPATIEPFDGQTVQVIAQNVAFDLREIRVNSGGNVRLRLDNKDTGVEHNIAVRKSATDATAADAASIGLIFAGPGVDDTVFPVPARGTYSFRCDVHPTTMVGSFIVQ